jgi:hypothetical protein
MMSELLRCLRSCHHHCEAALPYSRQVQNIHDSVAILVDAMMWVLFREYMYDAMLFRACSEADCYSVTFLPYDTGTY